MRPRVLYSSISIKMTNPLQLALTTSDGSKRNIIIEPVLEKDKEGLKPTGAYKIFKDAFGDESTLFTESLETAAPNDDLDDSINPDYLGKIIFDKQSGWIYQGDLLSLDEQKQAATYIMKY